MVRATRKNVEQQIGGPDFDAALAIINGRIAEAKTRQQKASGDASQAWGSIEKLGVNKKGAQMFARVAAIEDDDDQQDQLRTFFALCKLEGISLHFDMVDEMEGNGTAVPKKAPGAKKKNDPAPEVKPAPEGDTDLADGAPKSASENVVSLNNRAKLGIAAAKEAAREQISDQDD